MLWKTWCKGWFIPQWYIDYRSQENVRNTWTPPVSNCCRLEVFPRWWCETRFIFSLKFGEDEPISSSIVWHSFQMGGKKPPPFYPVKLSQVPTTAFPFYAGWVGHHFPEEVQDVTTRTGSLGTRISSKKSGCLVVLESLWRLAIGIIFWHTPKPKVNRALICPTGFVFCLVSWL